MPWILNEDAALKLKMQGLVVYDANAPEGGRAVQVRYRLPEDELSNLSYPVIVIEFLGAFYAPERAHRSAPIQLGYAPEGYAPWTSPDGVDYDPDVSPYRVPEYPIPYNLDYQVTLYSRLERSHRIPLLARLQQPDKLPPVGGYLVVPQDNTVRTMLLTGGPTADYAVDEDGKRLFSLIHRVRVFSELIPGNVTNLSPGLYPRVAQLDIDLSCYSDTVNLTEADLTESFGIMSSSVSLEWNTLAKQ